MSRALLLLYRISGSGNQSMRKAAYLDLARQWTKLATDIEMAEALSHPRPEQE